LALGFKAVDQFERSWKDTPPYTSAYHYARLLTHIAKNVTADMSSHVTETAMELLGGLGFLNEYPIERLHREALITPIWEGPSNIQALDMLEAMVKKNAHLTLLEDVKSILGGITDGQDLAQQDVRGMEEALSQLSSGDGAAVEFSSKDALNRLGHSIATIMLLAVGNKLRAQRFVSIARLYSLHFVEGKPYPSEALPEARKLFAIDQIKYEARHA